MVGASNVMLLGKTVAGICQLQALSYVGRCKSFDATYATARLLSQE